MLNSLICRASLQDNTLPRPTLYGTSRKVVAYQVVAVVATSKVANQLIRHETEPVHVYCISSLPYQRIQLDSPLQIFWVIFHSNFYYSQIFQSVSRL